MHHLIMAPEPYSHATKTLQIHYTFPRTEHAGWFTPGQSVFALCYYNGEWPGSAVDLVTESRLSSQADAHVLAYGVM